MWIAVNRQDGRNGLGDSGFLSIQVLLDRLPINHLLQLQQREAVDMLGNHGLCGLPEEDAHRKSPKCLSGSLGDLENFAKVSGSLGNSAKGRLLNTTKRSSEKFSDDLLA